MKHIFTLCLSLCLLGHTLHAATVAYYEFDGSGVAPAGSAITDSSGNNHHGAVAGGPLNYGLDPLVGGYLHFNADGTNVSGLGNRVEVTGSTDFLFTPDQTFTVEVIFRTTQNSSATNGVLISKGCDVSNPDSQWWMRHQGSGQIRINIEGADNTTEDNATSAAGVACNDGQWHRAAAVYDGTQATKRLDIYVDGVLKGSDTSIGTLGIIGGTDTDPVIIGEFATLVANRSFEGDIAAVRISNAALTPPEFLPVGKTYLTDLFPTNGASFLAANTVASFVVNSPYIGVAVTNIHVALNDADVTGQLAFAGTDTQRTVTLASLSANQSYTLAISVVDKAGNHVSQAVSFNTFADNLLFVEGEDYNFESGQFIDNPPLSSSPGPSSYLDRLGVEGVDYHQTNAPATTLYRIGDQVGTAVSTDVLRQAYVDAIAANPGIADYMARDFANTEWLNYTRTFPENTYRVYARVAKGGTVPIVMHLDEVTSGSTTANQVLAPLGFFRRLPTLGTSDYDFVPLTDALGQVVALPLTGVKALRLTMVSGTAGMNLNYLVFVPPGGVQRPFLASVSPAAGAGNESSNLSIQATIRNGDTTVSAGTIQLRLDGTSVSPTTVTTSSGATVSYTPSVMSTGVHTATLVFTDSAATSITNSWQFYVANRAVRGYWKFDESAAGNYASTNAGAMLDASGNSRHGTTISDAMPYVIGSINYGNTRALKFTSGVDRIVVPDAADNFNFSGSVTFEAVVRTTNSTTGAAILAKNGTGDGEGEYWWRLPALAGGKQRMWMNGASVTGTATLNDGAWHHVAVVYDQAAAELRLYADYVLETNLTGVAFDKPVGRPADLQIGGFIGTTTSEFDGEIDFIRISDGALTTDQFAQRTVPLAPLMKASLPLDGARGVAAKPVIQAEIQNRDLAVNLSTLRLYVDGTDLTATATKSGDSAGAKISYTPAAALVSGAHTATVTFSDNGSPAASYTNLWSFTVVSTIPVLGLYQFNEKAAGSVADTNSDAILDASGQGRSGTASTALPYVAGSPAYGNTTALQFTVGGGHVVVPDVTAGVFNFTPTQSITMEAILRTVAIGESGVGCIAAKQGTAPGEWWWRINASGTQQFWLNDSSGSRNVAGNTVLNDGLWHHVAAVYDAVRQEARLYVDYQPDGSAAAAFSSATNIIGNAKDLWIGAFQAGTRQLDGELDAIRISGEALDPSWFIPLGGVVPQPTSVLLTNVRLAGSTISFSFATQAGFSYVVQATDALGGNWGAAETVAGDGSVKTVSYPLSGERRFYRVESRTY